jgi:hypothetical protein
LLRRRAASGRLSRYSVTGRCGILSAVAMQFRGVSHNHRCRERFLIAY